VAGGPRVGLAARDRGARRTWAALRDRGAAAGGYRGHVDRLLQVDLGGADRLAGVRRAARSVYLDRRRGIFASAVSLVYRDRAAQIQT
jgi:hypothetical protein